MRRISRLMTQTASVHHGNVVGAHMLVMQEQPPLLFQLRQS